MPSTPMPALEGLGASCSLHRTQAPTQAGAAEAGASTEIFGRDGVSERRERVLDVADHLGMTAGVHGDVGLAGAGCLGLERLHGSEDVRLDASGSTRPAL